MPPDPGARPAKGRAEPPEQIDRNYLAAKLVRFCRFTESLARETARLNGRIQPFDDETELRFDSGLPPDIDHLTAEKLIECLSRLAYLLRGVEAHLNAVRSRLDLISNDVVLREDLKPYLDQGRRR